MTIVTILPAVETPSLIMREIEASDWKAFSHFMTQASYQRHIAMRLRNEDDVKNFVTRQVARQGDERRHIFHLAAEDKKRALAVGDGFIILGDSAGCGALQRDGDVFELGILAGAQRDRPVVGRPRFRTRRCGQGLGQGDGLQCRIPQACPAHRPQA